VRRGRREKKKGLKKKERGREGRGIKGSILCPSLGT
jgi:hypothetical protein